MEVVYSPARAAALTSPLRPLYLVHGEDAVRREEVVALLRTAMVDDAFADFDYEVLDATAATAGRIATAAGVVPLASERRLIVVRHAEALRRRERQADAEALASALERPGAACVALVCGGEEAGRGKSVLTARIDALARSTGCIVHCRALDAEGLVDALCAQAAAADKELEEGAARRLAAVGHGDRVLLAGELEKAICHAGDAPRVTLADVEAVCGNSAEDVVFRLVDAVGHRSAERALALLHEALRYEPRAHSVAGRLLALLGRQLRLLWQARELAARRVDAAALRSLPDELAEELPSEASIMSMAWRARELYAQARRWDRAALAAGFQCLVECDLANKGDEQGSADVVTNLEVLVVRLCRG